MDDNRFDRLTKELAGTLPRRSVLRALLATAAGVGVAGRTATQASAQQQDCAGAGGNCSDHLDCCNPAICVDGHCCRAGRVFCKGRCVPECAAPNDQCHAAGVLNPNTCSCDSPPLPNGTACDDGDPCTEGDSCQGGQCQPGTPKDCSHLNAGCVEGVCQSGTGTCFEQVKPDFSPCDDGNFCTRQDVCVQGICVGRDPVICPGNVEQCKTQGTCDPTTGVCNQGGSVPDGTECNDFDPCSQKSTCLGGKCVGSNYVLTCDHPLVCIKDRSGQFVCAKKKSENARDFHP